MQPHPDCRTTRVKIAFLLLAFAILCRFQTFGNPLVHVDEEFYLFVGGRILQGNIPYVDIWDRKPVGLFLLYAFFHLFGPYRIWVYQIAALLSVWRTSFLIMKMARTIAPLGGAIAAALLYICWLELSGGEGGQSPVFYNLLVATAMARVVFQVLLQPAGPAHIRRTGLEAMALFGLALQIKYTVVFEGIYLGCFLLWYDRRIARSWISTLLDASLWIGVAILPTGLVAAFYYLEGHGQEWVFANINSIFLRSEGPTELVLNNIKHIVAVELPLILGGILTYFTIPRVSRYSVPVCFFELWAASSCLGLVVFGGWYNHYALPTFLPLALINAPLWNRTNGRIGLVSLIVMGTIWGEKRLGDYARRHGDRHTMEEFMQVLSKPSGCVFVYEGPVAPYDRVPWCHLTTHPFPGHFHQAMEAQATGMNPVTEIQHVLMQKPRYIFIEKIGPDGENTRTRSLLMEELNRNYHIVYSRKMSKKSENALQIFSRNTEFSTRSIP
ncbi:hypothetical protein GOB87_01435 [Acetobacter estunensis]|uniref:Glycosyltransferase RgtA/B/C/D-like domain-containing protein n=1 Tax=Acetobacter estunensis TaxID=104097 RepID=A0A967EAQ9_9PROT|nr:hypothetical protein [Acetobacter estunensis]NHO52628.1 hypothetical protein [Acetobacter estunensis]